jgi:magnesium transporter
MPEIPVRWAYPALWAVMLTIAGSMWLFFRRKGWVGGEAVLEDEESEE